MRRALIILAVVPLACGGEIVPDPYGDEAEARAAWLRTLEPPLEPAEQSRVLELVNDPHPSPRQDALIVMARTGDPSAWAAIQPKFKDEVPEVRRAACRASQILGHPGAIPELATLARSRSEDLWVRQQATEALVSFGNRKESIRALIDVLNDGGGARPKPPDLLIGETTVVHTAHMGLMQVTGRSELSDDRLAWLQWYRATHGE